VIVFSYCPEAPEWTVDWSAIDEAFPWIQRMRGCPQDPLYHAEGDVWIHTRMVCEALAALPIWRALPDEERRLLFASALLHDVGKPDCTRTESDGRITSRGHSRRGAIIARNVLWHAALPFTIREQICALIRFHQVPYYLIERADPLRSVAEISQTARCDLLTILAEADVRGRICAEQQRLLDNVALFAELCREHDCLTGRYAFPSEHSRFLYFREERRHPCQPAHADHRAEVVMMSGLPGAGKDRWIRSHLPDMPVIALDALRDELDISPADNQGTVVNRGREMAREHLRKGRSFVWNATNVSRQLRGGLIDLFAAYDARVRIVYVETTAVLHGEQNRHRPSPVPEVVIERLRDRWDVPDITESHQVDYAVRDSSPGSK
jgi:predicted kinase